MVSLEPVQAYYTPDHESNPSLADSIPFLHLSLGFDSPILKWSGKTLVLSLSGAGEIAQRHRHCAFVSRQPFSKQLARQQVPE